MGGMTPQTALLADHVPDLHDFFYWILVALPLLALVLVPFVAIYEYRNRLRTPRFTVGRFSIRSLLLVTALFAVALGLAVYMARKYS
jgi:hypothetical protein